MSEKKITVMSRIKPKAIRQKTSHRCWAAALESWLDINSRKKINQIEINQKYLIKNFGLPNGGLTENKLETLANVLFMRLERITIDNFNVNAIKTKLQLGHLYIIYKVTPAWSHAVVLYGVKESTVDEPKYMVMDPYSGYKDRYKDRFFSNLPYVVIGYPTAFTFQGLFKGLGF